MRRRALLRACGVGVGAGTVAATLPAGAAARPPRLQDAYEPLARLSIDNAAEVVVGDGGETAYVAATTGFVTVDVSDPTDPAILAEERGLSFDGARMHELLDAKVDGERLVVASPANDTTPGTEPDDDLFYGFACYDVGDPSDPELLEAYETDYHIHNCYLEDETLYVVRNGPDEAAVVVYDVEDGAEEIGRWSLLEHEPDWADVHWLVRYLHDVYVQDDVAYLPFWDAGTYLVDVSDPAEPEYISQVAETTAEDHRDDRGSDAQMGLPGNDHYAAVDETGDLLAVGREAWATGGDEPDRPGGIDLYDVSDPAAPEHRATIDAPRAVNERYGGGLWTTAHNFELRDGRLYSSWYQGGVRIYDVSDPAEPDTIASWRDPGEAGFWTARVLESEDADAETFVSTSTPLIPNAPTTGALYTFPIEAGEQADPPSLTDPDDLGFDVDPPEDETNETEPAADENGTGATADGSNGADGSGASTDGSDADDSAADDSAADGSDDSIPGFTAGFGLAGGAGTVALEWLRRRRDNQEPAQE